MGAPTPEVTNGQAKTRRQLVTDLSSHEASGESSTVARHTASGAPPPLSLGVPRLGRGTCPTSLRHVRNVGGVLCRSTRAFACA